MCSGVRRRGALGSAVVLAVLTFATQAMAWVQPASVFQNGMVLQRSMPIPVWGTAEPGERVKVYFGGQLKVTTAGKDSHWMVKLDPVAVNPIPQRLSIIGWDTVTFSDVLVGEVWLASGQSNMQYTFRPDFYPDEVTKADRPLLRTLNVSGEASDLAAEAISGTWETCTPDTVSHFSAVSYFFATRLQDELKVPIGIINASWGGTPIEAWTSLSALTANARLARLARDQVSAMASRPQDELRFDNANQTWEERYGYGDPGNKGFELGWAEPSFDAASWPTVKAPFRFPAMGLDGGGIVWLRKEIDIPADRASMGFGIDLGWAADSFECYWNGMSIATSAKPHYGHGRSVWVDGGAVESGRNVLAVRLVSHTSADGISSAGAALGIPGPSAASSDTWQYKVEVKYPRLTAAAMREMPTNFPTAEPQLTAGYLFNGLISPLIPFAMRGAIWYQGENNADDRAPLYEAMLTTLIDDWRTRWHEGPFPFYVVQLANFNASLNWALVREGQLQVSRNVQNTGLAVTVDIGDATDVHPRNKKDVGYRLALNALAKDYARDIEWSGPLLDSVTQEGQALRARFSHLGGGLVAKGGGPLKQFEVAGTNGRFVAATASIDGDTLLISSPRVTVPSSIRYAWAANPIGANFYNAAGLPASPFISQVTSP